MHRCSFCPSLRRSLKIALSETQRSSLSFSIMTPRLRIQFDRLPARAGCWLGLLSSGFEDQPGDLVRMRDHRHMARLQLDGLGAHALGHEAFEIGIDRAVFRRNGIETRLRPPR